MKKISAVTECHSFVSRHVKSGDICIDATAGNGHDTAFLCSLVGKNGKVLAFDVQELATTSTRQRIEKLGFENIAEIYLDSHENMGKYAETDTISCIMFNFGYLPSGDHNISTKAFSSIPAIEIGLDLLKPTGIMCLCIYYGGDTGYDEKNAIMDYLKTLDFRKYVVITHEFYNMPNDAPIPVFIHKLK